MFVAEDAGRIVGYMGYIQARINVNGARVSAVRAEDGFVHPGYWRQGMSTALAETLFSPPVSDFVRLGLGTPIGRITAARRGYHHLGNMVRLRMVLNPRPIVEKKIGSPLLAAVSEPPLRLLLYLWAGRKRRTRGAEDITIETVDSFDSRFDELWSTIKDDLPLGLWQDAEYLNWRYRASVTQHIVLAARKEESLLGFIVLRWGDEGEERYRLGYVVDFLFAPQKLDAAPALISAAVNYFREGGADAITCGIFGGGPFYRLLGSCGFFRWGRDLSFDIKLVTPDVPHSLLLDPGNWYFMEGLT